MLQYEVVKQTDKHTHTWYPFPFSFYSKKHHLKNTFGPPGRLQRRRPKTERGRTRLYLRRGSSRRTSKLLLPKSNMKA